MSRTHGVGALAAACVLLPFAAGAQMREPARAGVEARQAALAAEGDDEGEVPRAYLGGGLLAAFPVGELSGDVESAVGFGGYLLLVLPAQPAVGLRVELSDLLYGSEDYEGSDPALAETTIDKSIRVAAVGGQWTRSSGWLRPFVGLSLSYVTFSTDADGKRDDRSVELARDAGPGVLARAGSYLRLGGAGSTFFLDAAVTYHGNGKRRYMPENGSALVTRRADFTSVQVGATLGRF